MIKNKLKEKRGDSSVFQILMCIGIITFLLFFPVITFSYFKLQCTSDAAALDAIQLASVRGGVDNEVIALLVNELEDNGYSFNGSIINQADGNAASSVRIYTNVPLTSSHTLSNGKIIKVEYLDECADSSSNLVCNSNRRYRTDNDKTATIKIKVVIPVSTQSKMINNLYTLVGAKPTDGTNKLEDNAGYVATYSVLSELYDFGSITSP